MTEADTVLQIVFVAGAFIVLLVVLLRSREPFHIHRWPMDIPWWRKNGE